MLNVKSYCPKWWMVSVTFGLLAAFSLPMRGQDSKGTAQPPLGLPDDWTHRHMIFSHPGTEEDAIRNGTHDHWGRVVNDPRYMMQRLKQEKARDGGWLPIQLPPNWPERRREAPESALHSDWSMDLNSTSATVGPDNFPAKYSFSVASPTTANCAGGSAPDFVVYNTSQAGSTSQASIIAYDNLYATTCAGTVPQTLWAYDTGGTISTSVVLSLDGTQVAFIHSANTASLVLLKWSATGGAFTGTTSTTTTPTHITAVSVPCTDFAVGTPLFGPGIATGATVSSCSGTTIVMSASATASGTTQPLTYSTAFTGDVTSGSADVTSINLSCTPLVAGTPVYGTGIPQGDTVSSCNGTTLVLTTAANAGSGASETLTYSPGTAAAPVVLTTQTSAANYRNCVAPCMYTIAFGNGYGDTISSPFYDYTDDVIYVGDNGNNSGTGHSSTTGYVHKFTGVFLGTTPAEATSGWPASAGSGSSPITGAVWDAASGYVYSTNYLTTVTEMTPAGAVTSSAAFTGNCPHTGGNGYNTDDILEAPIVDGSAGKIYLFEEGQNHNCVAQFPTDFGSGVSQSVMTEVGTSANVSGDYLYAGAFDNGYYKTNGTGNLYVCGNNGGDATLYQIPISSGTMSGTANTGPALTTGTDQCSPVTEVYNTVASGGPYDWLYLGVRGAGSPSGCGGGACVMNVPVTGWLASTSYSLGQMIVNNYFNIEVVTTAGTSGTTQPTWPAAGTIGTTTTDGGVTWTSQGPFTFTPFQTYHTYSLHQEILDSNNNLERVTTAGFSNGTPTWATAFGATTTSNTVTFTNQGSLGINGAPYTGGTSGITIDNISTASGASNIYFSTLGSETCTTSGGTGGCAVQASQSAP
jgi:hypothetical protein